MLLKALELHAIKYITSCLDDDRCDLTFYCHNELGMVTFEEVLSAANFQQRLKNLNARVKFPENAVRMALTCGDPVQASLAEENPAGVQVLSLKFSMGETAAPLKWEWHLKRTDVGSFYRQLCVDAMSTGKELLDIVTELTNKLVAKDKELEQYRKEGFQLRRTTVKTKEFDLQHFNEGNNELLTEARSYLKINDLFGIPPDPDSAPLARTVPSTPSTPSASSNASNGPSPSSGSSSARSRKRKAQESNTNHLERKVMQRRNQPQIEYKNSQSSQEDAIIDWLVENKPPIQVKPEPESETAIKSEASGSRAPVKTEINSEDREPVEEPPVEELQKVSDDSDQELNELRSILGQTMGQKLEKQEE